MKRAKWRVCDVRNIAGVDYSAAHAWKTGRREMKLESAAILQAALNKKGIKSDLSDFVAKPSRKVAA
jgi:hypothetical protein